MGFWGKAEAVAVDGVAGVAGLVESADIPGISEVAGAVATGVHAADALGHGIAGAYDDITGDSAAADKQYDIAGGQAVDALAAGASTLMPGNPIASGISTAGALSDLAHTGSVLAGGTEENGGEVPTLGDVGWKALTQ
jgi:hypothetical protein